MAKMSIMKHILSSVTKEGALPRGYHLPDEKEEVAGEMRFLDGAEDGVRLYHMKVRQTDLIPFTTVLYEIKQGKQMKAERSLRKAVKGLDASFARMIDVVGPLEEWMKKHPNVMQDECFLRFALSELMITDSRDMVKFCLALLSIYDLDEKGQIARLIRTLALSDEFTFQCITIMKNWKEGNEEVFQAAKRVYAWGRIHAVHYLEAETQEIRRWLLTEGYKNDVRIEYTARDIAVKLPLIKLLTDPALSDEEFEGISAIMEALMTAENVPGIDSLSDKDILMDVYLKAAQGRILTRAGVAAVSAIRGVRQK